MSDTEEGSFDKEAEKEKLREQLRREEENRRSTQHMSELLLKGATMTNRHCDTCSDPLFRYEGQEFCPTCSQDGTDASTADRQDGTAGGADETAAGEEAAGQADGADARADAGIDRVDAGTGIEVADSRAGDAAESARTPRPDDSASGDVAAARAALVRKLESLAREAEATEDVGRSRELLAAAREAAEALAAVDSLRG